MLAGCGLWKRAVYSDRSFMLYLRDRNFLQEALPITKSASRILRRIFTMDPNKRISLAQLRLAVLGIDRLYLTSDELQLASEEVQEIADRAIKLRVAALESESDWDSYLASSRSQGTLDELQRMNGRTLIDPTSSLPSPDTVLPPLPSVGPRERLQDCSVPAPHLAQSNSPLVPAAPVEIPPMSNVSSNPSSECSERSLPSDATSSAPITPETLAASDAVFTTGNRSVEDLALPPPVACEGQLVGPTSKLLDPVPAKERQDADEFMSRVLGGLRE